MRILAAVVGLVAVLSFAAPFASAQVPDTCGPIGVTPPAATTGFEAGESRALEFVVTNEGNVDATVTMAFDAPPSGWQWPTTVDPVAVPVGAEETIEVQVRYLGQETASTVDLIYEAGFTCAGPVPVTPAPVRGSVSMQGVAAPGSADTGGDGSPWPMVLLAVGGLVLVGAVFYSTQTKRGRVSAIADESEKTVTPGRGTSFPVTLANRSGASAPLQLAVSDVPGGWSALTALPELTLGPKEERTLWVMVRAPESADPGTSTTVTLTVSPEKGRPREVVLTAIVGEPVAQA